MSTPRWELIRLRQLVKKMRYFALPSQYKEINEVYERVERLWQALYAKKKTPT